LNLSFNKIKVINPELELNTKLKVLNLSYNRIKEIPKVLGTLEHLEELNICGNPIEYVHDHLKYLKYLKTFDLSLCNLKEIPKFLFEMKSLETLYLRVNKLQILDFNSSNFENLKYLDLRKNQIKGKIDLTGLENLRVLKLDKNEITEILMLPENLIEFSCSKNKLYSIQWKNLLSVETLNLSWNSLTEIEIHSKCLKELNLDNNQLKLIDLKDSSSLIHVNLSRNRLVEVKNLSSSIQILKLHSNENLKEIENFKDLVELTILNLCFNVNFKQLIQTFDFKSFTKLEQLLIGYLDLDFLSFKTKDFENLQTLFISGNNIIEFPVDEKSIDFYNSKNEITKNSSFQFFEIQGRRESMEDALLFHQFKNKNNEIVEIFGLFDGHAGDDVSKYLSSNFGKILEKNLKDAQNIKISLEESFQEMVLDVNNYLINESDQKYAGSTAIVMIKLKKKIYFANLGDSRAIYGNKVERITEDHKPLSIDYEYIVNAGGHCSFSEHDFKKGDFGGRINGNLAISRSFGDLNYSKFIRTTPSIYERDYEEGDVIILGCDGVWDVLSEEMIVELVKKDPNNCSQRICDASFISDSLDNVSVIVINL
jgi:serine/threonine protein phosphatase PrpC